MIRTTGLVFKEKLLSGTILETGFHHESIIWLTLIEGFHVA